MGDFMKKTNITAIVISAIIVAGILFGIFMFKGGEDRTVQATGSAQMSVAPDEVLVYLQIQTKSLSAETAKNRNAEITDDVLTGLIKLGLERKDIETENYNIYPEYDWSKGKQEFKGYVASNYMKVKATDFDKVGDIIDSAVDAGALVNYINFELSTKKSNEYKAKVLAEASKDAKIKAESIAAGLGKELGSLVSVTASDYSYVPYPLYRAEAEGESADVKTVATNIQPKNLDVTASATVTYKIK